MCVVPSPTLPSRENGTVCAVTRDRRSARWLLFIACYIVAVSSCAHQPTPDAYDPPGFFSGLLHGYMIAISLIPSIFWDIRIYNFPNSGFPYDLGFVIGAYAIFDVGHRSSRART